MSYAQQMTALILFFAVCFYAGYRFVKWCDRVDAPPIDSPEAQQKIAAEHCAKVYRKRAEAESVAINLRKVDATLDGIVERAVHQKERSHP